MLSTAMVVSASTTNTEIYNSTTVVHTHKTTNPRVVKVTTNMTYFETRWGGGGDRGKVRFCCRCMQMCEKM